MGDKIIKSKNLYCQPVVFRSLSLLRLSLMFHFIPSKWYRLVVVVWSLHERFLALGLKMHTSVNYMAQGDFGTHVDRSLLLTIDSRHSTCASSPENQLHLLTSIQFRECWFNPFLYGIKVKSFTYNQIWNKILHQERLIIYYFYTNFWIYSPLDVFYDKRI